MPHERPIATVILPSLDAGRARVALRFLAAQTVEHETIVVDNGSPGGTVSSVCAEFGFARPLRAESNLGFSRAVNLAADEARADALVLVNDDAAYDPDFVRAIVAGLDRGAGIAMAAGVLRSGTDERRIDTAGIETDHTLLAFDYLNGDPLSAAEHAPDPLGPSGAAAAYDRTEFARFGGMDERIFAYLEDLDLALRMRLAGLACRLVHGAVGTHHHSQTLGSGSSEKNYLMGFARGYLLRKWGVWSPRRAPAIVARECAICLGQIVLDRNLGGVGGRFAGTRTGATALPYPAAVIDASPGGGRAGSLRRRAQRRLRLRAPDARARPHDSGACDRRPPRRERLGPAAITRSAAGTPA